MEILPQDTKIFIFRSLMLLNCLSRLKKPAQRMEFPPLSCLLLKIKCFFLRSCNNRITIWIIEIPFFFIRKKNIIPLLIPSDFIYGPLISLLLLFLCLSSTFSYFMCSEAIKTFLTASLEILINLCQILSQENTLSEASLKIRFFVRLLIFG